MSFKTIPGYGIYRIDENGVIQCYLNNKVQFEVEQIESATSKGSYKVVNILNDKLHRKWRGVHQLVCLVYNGPPPSGGVYDVNHKDGNKHNNHYINLEWIKHSANTIHALENGLRFDNIPIEVIDILTHETKVYYSIIELGRNMNLPRSLVYSIIGRHMKIPFRDRLLFKIDIRNFGMVNRVNSRAIKIYDYVNKEWLYAKSINMAIILTGLTSGVISRTTTKYSDFILAGYHIAFDGEIFNIDKNITSEIAIRDRSVYYENNPLINDSKEFDNIVINEYN